MNKNSAKTLKNKTTIATIVLLLTLTISLAVLPTANAHTPPWTFTPYAYINASPNPVGEGQSTLIVMWLNLVIQGANIGNNIRFRGYQLTITKPDGTQETKTFDVITDTTSSQYYNYIPPMVGNYTIVFKFPGQTYDYGGVYDNDTYAPATATTTLIVQEEPAPKLPEYPLPSEYWTQPIEAENLAWGSISSNWLGSATSADLWQRDGIAPKTPHIMWTKPYEFGGLSGGESIPDATFYQGFSYETRFNNPIIISGVLYYLKPLNHQNSGGGYAAVDLRTGEEIWTSNEIGIAGSSAPSKAQVYNVDNPDQHGVVPPILWQTVGSTWNAYDAFTGKYIFNITNVPGGTEVYTSHGEYLRLSLSYSTATKTGTLRQWNNTRAILNSADVFGLPGWRPVGTTINAAVPGIYGDGYDFNVTVNADLTGSSSPTIVGYIPGDVVLGRSSNVGLTSQSNPNPDPWTLWALNLNPSKGPIGNLLWRKDYPAPAGNITRMLASQPIDPVNRMFTMTDFETGQRLGFSLETGNLVWGPLGDQPGFQYYSSREGFPAYGNLYVTGYGGIVYCYSMLNGTLLWTYGNGGEGNSTNSGADTPWGHYPIHAAAFADGVFYTMAGEHSPNTPFYKGNRIRALDAFTGEELWTLLDWSASGLGTSIAPVAVADGYIVYLNQYDGQIYAVGKGPSGTTVNAPSASITLGSSLVITGTVTDQSPGSKAKGTAAVSDESMSAWMEYLFMQKPKPMTAKGVEVTISVVDANGNYRDIGTTTSDIDGFFSFQWKPDIEGKYTVYASFAGSEAYWPSHAVAAFAVDPAPPPEKTPPETQPSMTDTYVLAGIAATIAAIAIVGALILLSNRKKH